MNSLVFPIGRLIAFAVSVGLLRGAPFYPLPRGIHGFVSDILWASVAEARAQELNCHSTRLVHPCLSLKAFKLFPARCCSTSLPNFARRVQQT